MVYFRKYFGRLGKVRNYMIQNMASELKNEYLLFNEFAVKLFD